ncbi:MAG TPA: hypothetical protein VEJ63_04180 [Planctomycetota bacterium]|nr:hypothetical protein [Planctomycetota bacterium]
MASCYKCAATITQGVDAPMPGEAVCEKCSSYLHCCANCASYDEYSQTKCREAKAEFVFDRLGKNACPFFKVKQGAKTEEKKKLSPRGEQKEREGRARENLARLFRS